MPACMYYAKICQSQDAEPQIVQVSSLAHAGQIMDTFLAVGWWSIDWHDPAKCSAKYGYLGPLVTAVRAGQADPLNPRIIEILEASHGSVKPE